MKYFEKRARRHAKRLYKLGSERKLTAVWVEIQPWGGWDYIPQPNGLWKFTHEDEGEREDLLTLSELVREVYNDLRIWGDDGFEYSYTLDPDYVPPNWKEILEEL